MSVFDNIDKELAKKGKNEIYVLYLLIVIVIGFLFYYFVYPAAKKKYDETMNQNSNLKTQISRTKGEINSFYIKIAQEEKKLKSLKKSIGNLEKELKFCKKEEQKLSFVNFDEHKWAKLLKDSVMRTIQEGIDIKLLSSQVSNINGYLKCFSSEFKEGKKFCNGSKENYKFINKKLVFTLEIKSDYKNLISFLYDYENKKELFRVESLNINNKKNYKVTISLYGYQK